MIFTVGVQILEDQYLVVALIAGFVAGVIFIVYRLSCRLITFGLVSISRGPFRGCSSRRFNLFLSYMLFLLFPVFLYFSTVDAFPTLFSLARWENM